MRRTGIDSASSTITSHTPDHRHQHHQLATSLNSGRFSPLLIQSAGAEERHSDHSARKQAIQQADVDNEYIIHNIVDNNNKHQQEETTPHEKEDLLSYGKDSAFQATATVPSPNSDYYNHAQQTSSRRTQEEERGDREKRTKLVHSISTTSLVSSNTPSSPPSLSSSSTTYTTTPSSTGSSFVALSLPPPFESPDSPCPSESTTHSLLSNSTLSSPVQISFPSTNTNNTLTTASKSRKKKGKMPSSSTTSTTGGETTTRRSSSVAAAHSLNLSNGSASAVPAGGSDKDHSLQPLASSTGSSSSSRRSGRKSATPSAINIQAANAASSGGPSSSSTITSTSSLSNKDKEKEKEKISSALLSGLLSPTSAQSLTTAQQTALERALAAGISRDEFEKTRASVVSMLRGQAAASSSTSSSSSPALRGKERSVTPQPLPLTSASADTSFAMNISEEGRRNNDEDGNGNSKPLEALPKLAISTLSTSSSTRGKEGGSLRSTRYSGASGSTLSASTSTTGLSDLNNSTAPPSTAASTLRTSVSSTNTDEMNARDSPLTSEEDNSQSLLVSRSSGAQGGILLDEQVMKKRERRQTPPRNDSLLSASVQMRQDDVENEEEEESMMMLLPPSSSVEDRSKSTTLGGAMDEEEDSSFNAATAAAAALGMLASSPVKVVERRHPTSNPTGSQVPFMNGASGLFSTHRGGSASTGLVSSSSPPLSHRGNSGNHANSSGGGGGGGQGLLPSSSSNHHIYSSPGSSSRSPLNHNNNDKNDSSDLSAEGLIAAAALGGGGGGEGSSRLTIGRRGTADEKTSTTPVRTRLEDIALKSSAQIRRQREILGLGEEEMMDLDTDLRHENALLRGAFDGDEEVEGDVHVQGGLIHDDEEMERQQQQAPLTRRRRQSSRRSSSRKAHQGREYPQHAGEDEEIDERHTLSGLAPPFSYPHASSASSGSTSRKASRSPSRPVSTGSGSRAAADGRSSTTTLHSRQTSRHGGVAAAAASSSSATLHHFSPAKLGSPQLPSMHQALTASSSSSAGPTSRRRAGHQHHRRVSSFGMSGMMDRFMESNYSPKASQIAKFEEAVRRASPERSSASYDTDRTLMHHNHHHSRQQHEEEEDADEDEDVYYEEVDEEEEEEEDGTRRDREDETIHSTPRTRMDKSRLLRSAGNDLPSPLLHQIRMLSDADHSPRFSAERPHRERETPRYARGAAGYSARQELGLASGNASSSEFGSARKRKASYDLQSPRHLVRNMQTSPTPEEDEEVERDPRAASPPPPFPQFEKSNPKFYERNTAGHPSSAGLFDGPTPSHSQSSSQSSAASYRLSQSQPHSSQHAHRQAYAQPQHHHPHSQQQHSRHYVQEHHVPPPHYELPSHQHPPSSTERPHPANYYQQYYPRHAANGADELSHYALAPPRPPSHGHLQTSLHSSHMSRPESVSSDYIPNQRELKKREKAMKKTQLPHQKERHDSVPSSTASGPAAGTSSAAASASTLENFVPANVQIGQYDEKTKPPFSYAALIGQAIFSTPNRRMSLADIYTYIMTLYPFYRKQDAGWQNSIRHNLSLNECFVKTQRGPDEPGKGCLWSILPGTEEQFTGGNFYKKGKIPKSALKQGGGSAGGDEGGSSVAPSSNDGGGKRKKANSVASGTETMSVMSADDSYETQSANSYSFASNNSSMVQPHGYPDNQRPLQQYAHHPAYAHQGYSAPHYYTAAQPHGPSSLRQKQQLQYSDEVEPEEVYEEEDDSFDMDDPPARYARPEQPQPPSSEQRYQQEQQQQQHRPKLVVKQPKADMEHLASRAPKRESSPEAEAEEVMRPPSEYDQSDVFDAPEAERSFSNSDRSGSLEPVKRQQPISHTSPVRRGGPHAYDRHRALLTSPPIMSSPPTNVFARMSQPYQPLRTSFNLPSSNMHAEALMSSPPPSSGIMPSDVRMRRLPPPTPRRTSTDGEEHPGSHIFLPAPNIKPGKASIGKKSGDSDDVKPTLPPIHMMSPASALALNTQSPVSSVRGSAAQNRSSSPSPKSSSQASSSANSITRSPTLNKSRQLHSSEVFKTPDRFAAPSSRSISSPNKLAHLANNNASKALQALQTPKIGASRPGHGLVTPGGYYDPYEYGAVLDEELDRMMATNKEDGSRGDRRPLPFPSPVDRTPKWQPWSPW